MKKIIVILLLGVMFSAFTNNNIWDKLTKLKFKIYYHEKLDDIVFEPVSTKEIRSLNGEIIEINGYLVNQSFLDGEKILLLSKTKKPFHSCDPKPEAMLEIIGQNKLKVDSETLYTLKGKFEFNSSDLLKLPYRLVEVKCLNCKEKKK